MSTKYTVDFIGGDKAILRGWKAAVGYRLVVLWPWLGSLWVRLMADEWHGVRS